ncbi:MAG: SUMF1/EgtB/PvdO family nonheme iron enzyme, partial [Chloroflexi bacterium]|nr:SUMF1/EgtB/PvdO family nonheme iron enzyme [Chloroflexota bacterium]
MSATTAELFLKQRLATLEPVSDHAAVAHNLITWGEYRLSLADRADESLPEHWLTSIDMPPETPVLGVRPSEAERFCQWLSDAQGQSYRLPASSEIPEAVIREIAPNGAWTRTADQAQCVRKHDVPLLPPKLLRQRLTRDADAVWNRDELDVEAVHDCA